MNHPDNSEPRGRRLRLVGAASIILTAIAAIAAATVLRAGRDALPASPEADAAIPVRVTETARGGTTFGRIATGTLEPTKEVWIGFPVPGVVAGIDAREGDAVEEGEILATLDAVPYRAEAEQARARTAFLRARIARTRVLAESGAVTAEELEGDVAELASAEAGLDRAEWSSERTILRAPFRGQLRADRIEVGQVVEAGDSVFELIAVDSLEIAVSVAVSDLPRIDIDAPVDVISVDLPAAAGQGRILHRPVSGDPRTSAVPLRIRLANPGHVLLPGTVAEVRFLSPPGHELPTVPLSALRVRSEGATVFVVEGGHARARLVETGTIREASVELVSGLSPGETVILEPPDRLRDGDRVRVVTEG